MKSYRQKSKGFLDGYNLMGISEMWVYSKRACCPQRPWRQIPHTSNDTKRVTKKLHRKRTVKKKNVQYLSSSRELLLGCEEVRFTQTTSEFDKAKSLSLSLSLVFSPFLTYSRQSSKTSMSVQVYTSKVCPKSIRPAFISPRWCYSSSSGP